jgi:TolB protein
MKKLIPILVIIFLLAGCISDKQIINSSFPSNDQFSSVHFYFPKPSELDSLVVTARAIISAPDMDSIFADLTVTNTQVEGVVENIPAGPHRKFEIFTYDANTNPTYYGHNYADVLAGQTITVQIILYPVSNTGTVIIVGTFGPPPPSTEFIVFEADYSGSIDLYRMRPDGTNLIPLTEYSDSDELRPFISPNRAKILFTRRFIDGRTRPYMMNIDGSEQVELNIHPQAKVVPWDWSPDMQKILLRSDLDGDWEIYVHDLNTLQLTQLTFNSSDDWHPRWSPDGLWIMYSSNENGFFRIFLMHPDGTNKHPLTPPISNMEQRNGKFAPDGSHVLFSGRDNYAAWDIFTVKLDGTDLNRLNPDPDVNDIHACWSPDGQKILFVKYSSSHLGLYTMNVDGSNVQMLLDDPGFMEDYPDWR